MSRSNQAIESGQRGFSVLELFFGFGDEFSRSVNGPLADLTTVHIPLTWGMLIET